MNRGKLQVKTDDAGTLSIEWDNIASIATADQYEVSMRDGTLLFGRFAPGASGTLRVAEDGGAAAIAAMPDIASFARIKAGFLQRIDGSIDLCGSYTHASGVGELTFSSGVRYRRPVYAYSATFNTNFTRQPDAPETSRYSLKVDYTRYRGLWLVSTFGLFEGNRDLGFTFRGTGAASIGRYLARRRHAEFLLAGGLAAGRELPVDASAVTNVDALVAANLSVFTYDYPTTSLDFSMLVFPSLDDPGRVRVNAEGKFKRELFKDFFVSVSGYDAFDNRPASATAKRNDFGASLSFGWTF